MTTRRLRTIVAAIIVSATAGLGYFRIAPSMVEPQPAMAATNAVTFPELGKLVRYTTVRRGITREHMLTSSEALAAINAGTPVPTGTHVVLVDCQSDVLARYLVSQKMGDGVDDWEYQWFWTNQSIEADENTARCYSCHRSRQDRQFLYTLSDALSFKGASQ